ncbi:ATP-binding protein [Pontibacterium sp.]|uniref:ATP-binding protein n=1 Tax=Pontibacterium sp. TaxID=2036026 RepID=UPI00351179E6
MANHHNNLLQLTYIRTVTLFGQSAAILFALYILQADLNVWILASTLAALALMNLATYARLRSGWPVTEPEFFTQLVADVVLYGCLLFQTGGATNPFIFLLLVPLIICSATLSQRFSLMMGGLVIGIYSSLLFYFIPIIEADTRHQHALLNLFDLHITGMWINFLLTVGVVTWFIVRMRQSMDRQQERLEEEREKRIHDQQLLSLATMAAGTAHELGTPLSTMRVLVSELKAEREDDPELQEDLDLMRQQIDACSERLQQFTRSVREEQASQRLEPFGDILQDVIEQWMIQRPDVTHRLIMESSGATPVIRNSTSLRQSVLNILNNAADAAPKDIEVSLNWDDNDITLLIHDQGPGLSLEAHDNLGKPFVSTKGRGLGIGLFLTATTLARYDGTVRLYNHPDGGTLTEVIIPRSNQND